MSTPSTHDWRQQTRAFSQPKQNLETRTVSMGTFAWLCGKKNVAQALLSIDAGALRAAPPSSSGKRRVYVTDLLALGHTYEGIEEATRLFAKYNAWCHERRVTRIAASKAVLAADAEGASR